MEALLQGIGNTPLIEIKLGDALPSGCRLFAKLESCNPGGSIKDRPVSRMLIKAREEGRFEGGRRLLDSSSGNAGIAYAMIGAA
ncbi:MAG: pyridoxal-phosphate dependent enzyme, partial [Planctomycetota bacterium]|nr:pyridoxal-phosphate dependent enzyme [Planctomycetota bacterium]